jgi:dTDP-glucose pyrophosphorylase
MKSEHDPFRDFAVGEDATIREAMQAIQANAREVVLVRDRGGVVKGLVTDGDIRRGLLAGCTLESPVAEVMTRQFEAVAPGADRAAVLDLMKARMFRHVPVLDSQRRLVGLHFLRDLIGAAPKPNAAVVMAGGKGTRLRPITETIPKPMVEVAGRPLLERLVLHLVGHGIHTIYLSVNYKSEVVEQHFGNGEAFGCRIEYLRESEPRGTGGSLSLLKQRPNEPLLVLNGDQITAANLTALLEAHDASKCDATVGVGPHHVQIPFGTATVENGRLAALEEKPQINLIVNRGIYVLEPEVLDYVPTSGEFPITRLFDILLEKRRPVGVYYFDDYWVDVGQPADLRDARNGT